MHAYKYFCLLTSGFCAFELLEMARGHNGVFPIHLKYSNWDI